MSSFPIIRLAILSDIHYACAEEKQRSDYLLTGIQSPLRRALLKVYRKYIWLRDPFAHNHFLDQFIDASRGADWVIANGDYSCDSAFVGISDDAACRSAAECLGKLRQHFNGRFAAVPGDHEFGKSSLGGGQGGLRLASLNRVESDLMIPPFWQIELGRYTLMGITSTLAAFPVLSPETLPDEREEWQTRHEQHLDEIRQAFERLPSNQRVLLFCHDPTALPFLARESAVQTRFHQIERTIIGHLHTRLIWFKSRFLAGMPVIRFMGTTPRRLSAALNQARHWRPFKVLLCPSLTGIQLLKDGGYYTAELDPRAASPARFEFHRLRW